ncbi:MAG: hypothetical protein V9E90_16675 [Saprospiraceae bacterium]
MTRSFKFILTTVWILFTRSYDAYCTNQLTPDLSKENNPLVSMLGMGWTALLITLVILTIYAIYAYFISVFHPKELLPVEKGYTFSNVIAFTYLGQKEDWPAVFYELPKDFNRFNQYMGHVLTKCLVYAGFVSSFMWLLINYTDYYKKLHSATAIYSILVIGCFVIIYNWNKNLYKEYLSRK